jgi:Spy/CpxP family protein refolding chaperone
MTDPVRAAQDAKPARRRPVLRRLLLGAAFAATFVAGGLVMSGVPAAAFTMAVESGEMGHGGMGHGGMRAMAQAHIDHMLTTVDATADQKARIHAIMKTAMESVTPLHDKLMGTHHELHQILTAPVIDRSALEQLRASGIGDVDQASKVLVAAIADAADVLSPAQRAKLGTLMAEHHHMHP